MRGGDEDKGKTCKGGTLTGGGYERQGMQERGKDCRVTPSWWWGLVVIVNKEGEGCGTHHGEGGHDGSQGPNGGALW